MTDVCIVRQVPLDQLVPPEEDVREGRTDERIQSLASSMGDPDIGQRQAITVYPADPRVRDPDITEEELVDLYEADEPLEIDDGYTRFLAAKELGWSTIRAVVHPDDPEHPVIARLAANTEVEKMSDFEVFRVLFDHYQDPEVTLDDVASMVGLSEGYVSDVFSVLRGPDWLIAAWKDPNNPVGTTHARAVSSFLSENTVEAYAEAGGLDLEAAREEALADAQLMLGVQEDQDLAVSEFRRRCDKKKENKVEELRDQTDWEEKQAQGTREAADQADTGPVEENLRDCMVCGGSRPGNRRKSIPVCQDDYGMLAQMEQEGAALVANAETGSTLPESPQENMTGREMAQAGLSEWLSLPAQEVDKILDKLEDHAQPPPQEPADGT